jgi:hypothetical protein
MLSRSRPTNGDIRTGTIKESGYPNWSEIPSEWVSNVLSGETGRRARHNSDTREGNMFKSIDTRRHVLCINKLRLRSGVLADAAHAIERGQVSRETAEDGAFAGQTNNIGNAGKCRTVLANGRVRSQREHAATALTMGTNRSVRLFGVAREMKKTHSFRDHEQCSRTPMRGNHLQERRRLPIQVPYPCKIRCRPSSSSC